MLLSLQHTIGHAACPACEAARRATMHNALDSSLSFHEASEQWIDSRCVHEGGTRARYIAPGTIKSYREYRSALDRFFADLPLKQIHVGHLRHYQAMRSAGELGTPAEVLLQRCAKQRKCTVEELQQNPELWRWAQLKLRQAHREVNPTKINQELGFLVAVMKRANVWTAELDEAYEHLQQEEPDIPRALSPQEQERLLNVASSRHEWRVVYWYTVVALRTTANNCEMRHLRMGDLNLGSGVIYVQPATAKNKYRVRTIPLAPDAQWAAEQLEQRAKEIGCTQPQHYLFPFRARKAKHEPALAMSNSGIKKTWEEIRRAAGVPWLRIHDLRHTAITRLAEAGTPIPVIMSMAGHISRRMLQHYTQISEQAQRMAVEAAYRGMLYNAAKPPVSYSTATPNRRYQQAVRNF